MPILFVYGTLAPENAEVARTEGWVEDAVRGRLYDLGPYPALIDTDDPEAGWVEGFVRVVSMELLLGVLDAYEGVDEGRYQRVQAVSRGGREIWLYTYSRALPAAAIGPLPRWNGKTRVRLMSLITPDQSEGEV